VSICIGPKWRATNYSKPTWVWYSQLAVISRYQVSINRSKVHYYSYHHSTSWFTLALQAINSCVFSKSHDMILFVLLHICSYCQFNTCLFVSLTKCELEVFWKVSKLIWNFQFCTYFVYIIVLKFRREK